jgi:hypothetical protein
MLNYPEDLETIEAEAGGELEDQLDTVKTLAAIRRRAMQNVDRIRQNVNRWKRGVDVEHLFREVARIGLFCEVSGLPFDPHGKRTWDSVSLDRIDNTQGYVPGNTRWVLWSVNAACGTWGLEKAREVFHRITVREFDKVMEQCSRGPHSDAGPAHDGAQGP